jgi:hypothetical protein
MALLSTKLAYCVIDDSLPWERSIQSHIDAFLQKYTLHDSYWIGLHTNCGLEDSAVAIIRFDPVWNSSVSTPTSLVADWPVLFIRFNCVNTLRMTGFRDIGGTQRGISDVSVDHLSDEEAVTTILDHYGASVSLQHFPLIDVLAISNEGNVLELSANSVRSFGAT